LSTLERHDYLVTCFQCKKTFRLEVVSVPLARLENPTPPEELPSLDNLSDVQHMFSDKTEVDAHALESDPEPEPRPEREPDTLPEFVPPPGAFDVPIDVDDLPNLDLGEEEPDDTREHTPVDPEVQTVSLPGPPVQFDDATELVAEPIEPEDGEEYNDKTRQVFPSRDLLRKSVPDLIETPALRTGTDEPESD
jgi:hypothetical protein